MKISHYQKAAFALLLANLIWGAGPPIFKWAFADVPTFSLAFYRYIIPIILLLLFFPRQLAVRKRDLPLIILSGFIGITLNITFYFVGIHYTASINATIIACAGPAFLILGAIFFLKERPTRKMLLGNVLGLTGVLFILFQPILQNNNKSSFFGNILLVFSTLAAEINTLLSKELIRRYPPVTLMFWTFTVGAISFYPLFLRDVAQYGFLTHLTFQGIAGIAFGSLLASFSAWLLFFYAIETLPASDTSVFAYSQPLIAIVIAMPLVHEYPTLFFIIGAILVIVGMYIAENHRKYPHTHLIPKK